jgi:hypothetical protein
LSSSITSTFRRASPLSVARVTSDTLLGMPPTFNATRGGVTTVVTASPFSQLFARRLGSTFYAPWRRRENRNRSTSSISTLGAGCVRSPSGSMPATSSWPRTARRPFRCRTRRSCGFGSPLVPPSRFGGAREGPPGRPGGGLPSRQSVRPLLVW